MKIVITPRGFANVGVNYVEIMRNKGFEVDYNDTGKSYTIEQFYDHCKDADALIVGVEKVDKSFIDSCPKLKIVCKFGVGIDNIDVDYCSSKNIKVERTVGSNSRSVAELAMTYIIADTKNLIESVNETKKGNWNKYTGSEVFNKTVGIIGFGAIGKHLATMCNGLGMNVLTYDAFPISNELAKEYNVTVTDCETIYKNADFISVHVPLMKETENMISLSQMKLMKPNCVLINAARGGIVNENDLYIALKEGIIRSAYFDVFTTEPPKSDEKLLQLNNFYITPHIGARSKEAEINTCRISSDIVTKFLEGIQ